MNVIEKLLGKQSLNLRSMKGLKVISETEDRINLEVVS
jgi:hypothetical protein